MVLQFYFDVADFGPHTAWAAGYMVIIPINQIPGLGSQMRALRFRPFFSHHKGDKLINPK